MKLPTALFTPTVMPVCDPYILKKLKGALAPPSHDPDGFRLYLISEQEPPPAVGV